MTMTPTNMARSGVYYIFKQIRFNFLPIIEKITVGRSEEKSVVGGDCCGLALLVTVSWQAQSLVFETTLHLVNLVTNI